MFVFKKCPTQQDGCIKLPESSRQDNTNVK